MPAESFVPTLQELRELVPTDSEAKIKLHGPPHYTCTALVGECRCILSIDRAAGRDWYHVSVSVPGRLMDATARRALTQRGVQDLARSAPALPSWEDLVAVRKALFRPDAVVVQVFPPITEWFSEADVLHLWQRLGADRLVPDLRRGDGKL